MDSNMESIANWLSNVLEKNRAIPEFLTRAETNAETNIYISRSRISMVDHTCCSPHENPTNPRRSLRGHCDTEIRAPVHICGNFRSTSRKRTPPTKDDLVLNNCYKIDVYVKNWRDTGIISLSQCTMQTLTVSAKLRLRWLCKDTENEPGWTGQQRSLLVQSSHSRYQKKFKCAAETGYGHSFPLKREVGRKLQIAIRLGGKALR